MDEALISTWVTLLRIFNVISYFIDLPIQCVPTNQTEMTALIHKQARNRKENREGQSGVTSPTNYSPHMQMDMMDVSYLFLSGKPHAVENLVTFLLNHPEPALDKLP